MIDYFFSFEAIHNTTTAPTTAVPSWPMVPPHGAAPCDVQQVEQETTGKTADDTENKIPQKTTALAHDLIGYETSQNTNDNRSNKSHNQKF